MKKITLMRKIAFYFYYIVTGISLMFLITYISQTVIDGKLFEVDWGRIIIGSGIGIIVGMHSPKDTNVPTDWQILFKGKRWWWKLLFITFLGIVMGGIGGIIHLLTKR
ncbi:MAG: hypothetical protein HY769_01915 [Candidatus Stahlbacteria bacterium]|nr:hypothetical protein [Candidatus Stahlbacteria bacterium]